MKDRLVKAIPSVLTLGNLCCGMAAIFSDNTTAGLVLIFCACVLDIFDGMLARILKAQSEFGKQLDALADLVSFGVAPAFLMYWLLLPQNPYSAVFTCLIPVFSAIRLARFNTDKSQQYSFKGLPTPANGVFFASLPYLHYHFPLAAHFPETIWYALCVLFALLMIIPLRMFSFKQVTTKGITRNIPIAFLLSIPVLAYLSKWWIPLSVISYIAFSMLFHLIQRKKTA